MAHVADADDDDRLGGAGFDHVATGATDFRVHIFRMNVRLHKKDSKPIMISSDDKREFLALTIMLNKLVQKLQIGLGVDGEFTNMLTSR
jgi:hypothetical protein